MSTAHRGIVRTEDRMTDEQAAEPPQGTPDRRALGRDGERSASRPRIRRRCPSDPSPASAAPARACFSRIEPRQRSGARSLAHRRGRRRDGAGRRCRHWSRSVSRHRHRSPKHRHPVLAGHNPGPRRSCAPRPPPIRDRAVGPLPDPPVSPRRPRRRRRSRAARRSSPCSAPPAALPGRASRSPARTSSAGTARSSPHSTVRWPRRAAPRRTPVLSPSRRRRALRPHR